MRGPTPVQKLCLMLVAFILCLSCVSCQTRKPPEKAVLGLCLPISGENFEGSLSARAKEAAEAAGISSLIETVSSLTNGVIDASITELIEKKVDAVVLYARDEEQCLSAARRLKDAGIPLILIGAPIDQELYTALVMGDYEGMGRAAGEAIAQRLNYKGAVLVLSGPPDRMTDTLNSAFTESLFPYADIEIISREPAAGMGDVAAAMVAARLEKDSFQAIFAHNDEMAIAAADVLKDHLTEEVLIITGIGGSREALDMLEKNNRYLKITFWNPADLAEEAVRVATRVMAGEEYEKDTIFLLTPVTARNAADFSRGAVAVDFGTPLPSAEPQP